MLLDRNHSCFMIKTPNQILCYICFIENNVFRVPRPKTNLALEGQIESRMRTLRRKLMESFWMIVKSCCVSYLTPYASKSVKICVKFVSKSTSSLSDTIHICQDIFPILKHSQLSFTSSFWFDLLYRIKTVPKISSIWRLARSHTEFNQYIMFPVFIVHSSM